MDIRLAADTIRGLAMDGVQKANSGHPGMPMGTADFASVLFLKFMNHDPDDAGWMNRDRYVQSAGHGSMLLYSLLHLSGYDLSLDDLKNFRQWESKTPGHPEYGLTRGVETTTGPLGQGCGNGVGMALAEAMLAAKFNRPGFSLVDHYTYVLAGDGDLMEGVSHEAFSLAGHLKLHKLIVFYDSNRITIEGSTDLAYSDDVARRFKGYRWNVIEIDGHDPVAIEQALRKARRQKKAPTLIIGHTHIAKGAPHAQDTSESHGAPLGVDEIKATKKALGLPEDQTFYVPQSVYDDFKQRREELAGARKSWMKRLARYRKAHPDLATEWDRHFNEPDVSGIESQLQAFAAGKPVATRKASGEVLQQLAKLLPQLVGGSADLGPSNNTLLKGLAPVAPGSYNGRNLHFGIREHGMGAVLSGMVLHGGWIVYGATFLVFSDYFRPSIRLAAMMELPVVYVFTHDSIFVGEDGPTHQPVEQLAALRLIPNIVVIRPADANETVAAWIAALKNRHGPTALILTRQNLPVLDRSVCAPASLLNRGAYTLWKSGDARPEILLVGTGSEVALALEVGKALAGEGRSVRVVSMPSWELFEKQDAAWRNEVLPPECSCRLVVEAGVSFGWDRYAGPQGRVIAMNRFGASAPAEVLAQEFGFTVEHVLKTAREMLATR